MFIAPPRIVGICSLDHFLCFFAIYSHKDNNLVKVMALVNLRPSIFGLIVCFSSVTTLPEQGKLSSALKEKVGELTLILPVPGKQIHKLKAQFPLIIQFTYSLPQNHSDRSKLYNHNTSYHLFYYTFCIFTVCLHLFTL